MQHLNIAYIQMYIRIFLDRSKTYMYTNTHTHAQIEQDEGP